MYRLYEDPRALENELAQAKRSLDYLVGSYGVDEDQIIELKETIADLEERVNIAWQDEAESEGYA